MSKFRPDALLPAKLSPPVVWDRQSHFANANAKAGCSCDEHTALCYVQAAYVACGGLVAIPKLRRELVLDELMALGDKAWFSDNRRVAVVKMSDDDGTNNFVIYSRPNGEWKAGATRFYVAAVGTEQDIGEVWFILAKEDASVKAIKALAERNA